ncbi:MAG TPA: hypothetical protein VKE98_20315, partial [Gemmataceae bacterium]|nr:hypothetical protein [Gemmataceae bacterium]
MGEATAGMTVSLTGCRFLNDQANGGAASVGTGKGGHGEGGAIFLDPESSAGLVFTASNTTFKHNSASGGTGGRGGSGLGGAIFILEEGSSSAVVQLETDTFNSDTATGGNGLNGTLTGAIAGEDGGFGQGGAVFIDAGEAAGPTFSFSTVTFSNCSATGGIGGTGVAGAVGG